MAPLVPDVSLLVFPISKTFLCKPKCDIFHLGYVLPSTAKFTSDGALFTRKKMQINKLLLGNFFGYPPSDFSREGFKKIGLYSDPLPISVVTLANNRNN